MNFFQQQENARRQSLWLIVGFCIATLLIILAVDAIIVFVMAMQTSSNHLVTPTRMLTMDFLSANATTLLGSSVATAAVIGLASLGKMASLRSGGGQVARDMGGTIISPDARDPLRRRLYNVVEEIALASGVPVPEVYVLENETGINAFAAGFSPADAAVAVTQGTLEKLSRSELQGVIAHEFSHILNGDMRINIRLMGVIFGIMILAILGRKFLYVARNRGRSSRNDGAGFIIAVGFGLMLVGYIGLFFARWLKAALSRQREYLADASAVQFIRDPMGISGALKKIAAYSHASYLQHDTEEVSHMLFGNGAKSFMFSTHPPLAERIVRIEKGFNAQEIEQLAKKLKALEYREHAQAQLAEKELYEKRNKKSLFSIDTIIADIGNPQFERILAAATFADSIEEDLNNAARSIEWAPEVLFYCLLSHDEATRNNQLAIVNKQMGDLSESKLQHLISQNKPIEVQQRLPLLSICFPSIKRRPEQDIEKILSSIEELMMADNHIDSFEYLLSRLLRQYLNEAQNPSHAHQHGRKKLSNCIEPVNVVVSVLASYGQTSTQGLQDAQQAYVKGMNVLNIKHTNLTLLEQWQHSLDMALEELNELQPEGKRKLVQALVAVIASDKRIVTAEHELLRIICACLHVPIPFLNKVDL